MPSSPATVPDPELNLAEPPPESALMAGLQRLFGMLGRLEMAVGGLLTVAAVYLHLQQNRVAGGLWRDEVVSVQVANRPTLGETWRYLEFDSYPALYHLVLRGWGGVFSWGDASLRTLGLLIGLGIVAALWAGGRALGARVPLLALALVGLNPMVIRYGDSIRAYGLGCVLAMLALAAVARVAMDDRVDWRRVALAMLAAVLSVQCLYHNAALLLASCVGATVVALWRRRVTVAMAALAIGVPAAMSLLPYLGIIARTRSWSILLKYPVTLPWLGGKLADVLGSPDPLAVWLWGALALAGFGWKAWSLRTAAKADGPRVLFAALTLGASALIYAAFLCAVGYITQPWYYLALVAVAGVCLDGVFGQSGLAPGWRLGRVVVVLIFAATTFAQSAFFLRVRSTNIDRVAARLDAVARSGDLILINRWECAISLYRYYHGPVKLLTVPPIDDHIVHRYDLFMRCMESPDPLRPVYEAIHATLQAGGHVWVVGYLQFLRPGESLPRLPPVSVKPGGAWPFGFYDDGWQLQVDEFLAAHALGGGPVDVPVDQPVSGFENQPLGFFEGWHDADDTRPILPRQEQN